MGKIEIILSKVKKVWFIQYTRKVRTGFLFTNKAFLILSENTGKTLDELFDWSEKNQTLYFLEMLYAAYLNYCQSNYKMPELNKQELSLSFAILPENDKKKIIETWANAENFGLEQSKKKQMKK